jgi:hypothetical protein
MLPCSETTAIAAMVILLQKRVEDASILQTNISIDNFVNVHAAANISSVHKTIFNPRVTSLGGISFACRVQCILVSDSTLKMKNTEVGIYFIALTKCPCNTPKAPSGEIYQRNENEDIICPKELP